MMFSQSKLVSLNLRIDWGNHWYANDLTDLSESEISDPESSMKSDDSNDSDSYIVPNPSLTNHDFEFLEHLPDSLTCLKVSYNVNQSIPFPKSLLQLQLGGIFNVELSSLPSHLTHLILGEEFVKPIKIDLPQSLLSLKLGRHYNFPIKLPSSLTQLELGDWFDQPLDLPNSITDLKFGREFNQKIEFPPSLTRLRNLNLNRDLYVPDSVTWLTLGTYFDAEVHFSPSSSLTFLNTSKNYNRPLSLPKSLNCVHFGRHYNQPVDLPHKLVTAKFGSSFNQDLKLPESLRYLRLINYHRRIDFPPFIAKFAFRSAFNVDPSIFNFPPNCVINQWKTTKRVFDCIKAELADNPNVIIDTLTLFLYVDSNEKFCFRYPARDLPIRHLHIIAKDM